MVKIKKQKVYSHRKKINVSRGASSGFKIIFKFILAVILLAALGIGFERFKYMFIDSDYFIIKGVEMKFYDDDGSPRPVSLDDISDGKVVGTNIFFMDLNDLKEKIENAHPEFKDVVIRRALPNKLIVQARKRNPVAQIRSDRFYLVDDEGIILPNAKNFPEEGLPIISGISVKMAKRLSGSKEEGIDKALVLIKAMRDNKKLSKYKLRMIDLADLRNVSFFLETSNVEIKIGDSEFNKRLDVLAIVLGQLGSDIDRVKYIDLRFEDPIVGPR